MTIKLRGKINFPATVTATGGLQVVKANGIWTVSPNFAALTSITASAVSDPTTQQVWIYNPTAGSYAVLTLAGLGDALFKLTSATSLAVGTGSKVLATQSGKDIGVGQYVLAVSDAAPSTNYMLGQVTAYASGSLTVNVTTIGGSGTYADWTIRVSGNAGATGATGPSFGIKQAYSSTTTDADPGAGTFRLNNATPASATAAYLDNLDSGAATVSGIFDLWDDSTNTVKGSVRFEKSTDPTVWAILQVTGSVVDGTGYRKLTLANGQGSGAFTNGDTFGITFSRAGDKGADGAVAISGTPSSGQAAFWTSATAIQGVALYTAFDNLSVHGADVASATTTNLETATGNLVDVTGTTTITAITLSEGHERTVRFTGILTLTHGASLLLPGAASITTAAGDYAVFRGYAASVVRCVEYTRASGKPVIPNTAAEVGAVSLTTTSQAFTGGINPTEFDNGTKTTGTFTPEAGNGPLQKYTNNGAHTLAAGSGVGEYTLRVTNGASAGAITFSGFDKQFAGDVPATTNALQYDIFIKVTGKKTYFIRALQ